MTSLLGSNQMEREKWKGFFRRPRMTTPIRLLNPRVGDHMVLLESLTTNDDVKTDEYTDTDGVLVRKASDRFGEIPVCHG